MTDWLHTWEASYRSPFGRPSARCTAHSRTIVSGHRADGEVQGRTLRWGRRRAGTAGHVAQDQRRAGKEDEGADHDDERLGMAGIVRAGYDHREQDDRQCTEPAADDLEPRCEQPPGPGHHLGLGVVQPGDQRTAQLERCGRRCRPEEPEPEHPCQHVGPGPGDVTRVRMTPPIYAKWNGRT